MFHPNYYNVYVLQRHDLAIRDSTNHNDAEERRGSRRGEETSHLGIIS